MSELLAGISAQSVDINFVLLIGIAIFFGTVGAKIFQRIHIPQIVGYVTIGIILGPVLKIISPQTIQAFEPFNLFALGIIGFLIGGELTRDIFLKFGKQVFAILLFEGGVAFLLVVIIGFLALNYFYDWHTALAVAVVFGAICSATDPASTVNILWEYKTRGPLTTMLTTIVALDDVLALVLYITGISLASFLIGHREVGVLPMIFHSLYDVIGSLGLGIAAGLILRWIIEWIDDDEKTLIFTISSIVLAIGLTISWKLDVILSSMACGVTLINFSPRRSLKSFELVRKFAPPIYVLFFVIIGARLNISLGGQIWLLAATYIIGTAVGKTTGSFWGSVYSKAAPTIRKYLGFCLYQQGTIAIALLIMASSRFEGQIRDTMVSVIIIGVFILQLIGPLFVKFGVRKAGEVGMNVTEEDLIKTYAVADVMDTNPTTIPQDTPLPQILRVFSTSDSLYYPVIDAQSRITGVITIADIKQMFASRDVAAWLLACDVAEPVLDKTTPNTPLEEAFDRMRHYDIESIPVVADDSSNQLVGVLDYRKVNRKISAEVLHRQKTADGMAVVGP
jgi:Kef-type K+ transport system membrane component KefB